MKTFLKIYISLCLILSPIFFINSANAATVGGWSLGGGIAQGASTVYKGTKQVIIDGKDYIKKGTAIVTPTATGVAKVLARGAAGYALSVAVQQLLGSVDWVLDPANNQIRYTEPLDPNQRYVYTFQGVEYVGPDALCNAYFSNLGSTSIKIENKNVQLNNGGESVTCTAKRTYSCYNGTQQCTSGVTYQKYRTAIIDGPTEEEKTLPLPVVAQKVISNAAGGDAAAQAATTAAAADIVAESESDNVKAGPIVQQLEATATTTAADAAAAAQANTATGTQTQNPTKPEATDLKISFPVFCGWAPVVCEAAQVAIQFPARVQTWVNQGLVVGEKIETEQKATTAEAAKTAQATQAIQQELTNENDLPQKDTSDIVLPDLPITPQAVNVNWGNSCPAPTTVNLSFGGQTKQVTILNYQFICEWAWVVEYSVIALASISSVFIVAGRKS